MNRWLIRRNPSGSGTRRGGRGGATGRAAVPGRAHHGAIGELAARLGLAGPGADDGAGGGGRPSGAARCRGGPGGRGLGGGGARPGGGRPGRRGSARGRGGGGWGARGGGARLGGAFSPQERKTAAPGPR